MYKSIVVGTDGSATASRAVSEAIELAKANHAKLHVVTAFQESSLRSVEREIEGAPDDIRLTFNARDAIDARANFAAETAKDSGVDVQAHTREDSPANALIDVASEEDADLIVVGNKGMTGAKRFLLGSVPNKVSHHAPCSVLIIRTT